MAHIVSPIDGRIVFRYALDNIDAAQQKVAAARKAQRELATLSIDARVALCSGFLEHYAQHLDAHAMAITEMMGKPVAQARGEFEGAVRERTRHMSALAPEALAPEILPPSPGLTRTIHHEPVGVVLDIAAWNYPMAIVTNVVVPALLAGNAVLIKHAPETAAVAEQFESAFLAAGAPVGSVAALHASHDVLAQLLAARAVDHVAFTGSVAGGMSVLRNAAHGGLGRIGLELGGNDAAYVRGDCDFDHAVENLVDGAYYNAGQSCCGIERIFVERNIYDRFVEAFAAKVRSYRLGDPRDEGVTLGPVVHARAAARVREHVAEAAAQGATIALAEDAFEVPDTTACYLGPTVVTDATPELLMMREETFGPTVGIMPVDSDAQAVERINDSPFGLTASIWSSDLERAATLARQCEAGTVFVNRCDYLDPAQPWTGWKNSGQGCTLSAFGFAEFTRHRSIHIRNTNPS